MNTTTIPRPEFPRPDFERKDWVNLNGRWEFSFDTDAFDRKILVPYCYQAKASGIGLDEPHSVVWYRRQFTAETVKLKPGRLLLKFGAVDYQADIYVNGVLAASHEGGHISFAADITDFVRDGENTLTVRVRDYPNADKPRGKQSWTGEKFGCWYTPTTGIWQTVWLEYVGEVYLQRVKYTPDLRSLTALCEVFISSMEETEVVLAPTLRAAGKEIFRFAELHLICRNGYGRAAIAFPDFDLRRDQLCWTPEHPSLVDVLVHIPGQNDDVSTYFGMRSVKTENATFLLNDEFYYQRLVLDQGYWTDTLLTPPSDEDIQKDITLTKAMGFNGARKHQKIEDPRYYYWADRLGLLVWGELPSPYEYNDNAVLRAGREFSEFILRDYNHPCIVTWVPINESWGVRNIQTDTQQQDFSRMMIYLAKALDPIRLVSGNDGWEQVSDTDICAIHDYSLIPSTISKYADMDKVIKTVADTRMIMAENSAYCGQPVILTEYGGIAFQRAGEEGWGYLGKVKDVPEFLARLEPITTYLIRGGDFSGFCYTQLTDVMQEVNGLLNKDRTPKIPLEQLKEIFGKARFA